MSVGRRSSRWLAAACLVVTMASGGVSACSKDHSDQGGQSQSQTAENEKPKTPTTGTPGKLPTLGDYIKQNGITESQAKHDEPGVPKIALPLPPGWADAGPKTPDYAYNAIIGVDPAMQPNPPTVVAVLSKLTGNVDPAEILSLAPNEIKNLPGFEGGDPQPAKISGFDSTAISGKYTRNGQARVIEQTTVVIPVQDGVYVLQINVDGVLEQIEVLMQVVDTISQKATITV